MSLAGHPRTKQHDQGITKLTNTVEYKERLKWFHEARFGLFIHWGLYSIPARGEWVQFYERIPHEEYSRLAWQFNPCKFDATAWVNLAKEAGAKYIVFTTRHHDGFCLFDSQVSDFTSVKTAAKRDFVAEFAQAAREAGMKVGFYYSLMDWRFPAFHNYRAYPQSAKDMVRQAHDQVMELMTNYGKVDVLWYDGASPQGMEWRDVSEFWGSKELNAKVRKLQPHILINNRSGEDEDIDTHENAIEASASGRGWETCMTMGDNWGWGYIANNPNMKPVPQLIQCLVMTAMQEGNLLLNIGPKPDGSIRREERDRLKAIGEWMAVHEESIRGSERCPFGMWKWMPGAYTAKGNVVYAHVFRWPIQGEIILLDIANKIEKAFILTTGQELEVEYLSEYRIRLKGLPRRPPHPYDTVIKLILDGKPRACEYTGIWS